MQKNGLRVLGMMLAAAVLSAGRCRGVSEVPVDTTQAKDIPRDIAVAKLKEYLPTAQLIYCYSPPARMKNFHVTQWNIEPSSMEIRWRGAPINLAYANMTGTRLDKWGGYYIVKVFSIVLPEQQHLEFYFLNTETAERVVELFESLRTAK